MKDVLIITVGKEKNREKFFNYQNIMSYRSGDSLSVDVKFITGNERSLAVAYNRHLNNPENRNKYLVFIHEDAIINDPMFLDKLEVGMMQFDVACIAGCNPPFDLSRSGGLCTWHNMGAPEHRHGSVDTYKDKGFGVPHNVGDETFHTEWGPSNSRVLIGDGVFMAINVENVYGKVEFDEKCPSRFHFYDLLFTLRANKVGLKVGVIPLKIAHCSPGLTKITDEYIVGNRYFGKILCDEGFLKTPPPEKPDLTKPEVIEPEEAGIIQRRDAFPIPLLPPIARPYFYIPEGGTATNIKRSLKHGGKLTKRDDDIPRWVHVPSDNSGCSWWRLCLIDQYGNYSNKAEIMDITTTIDTTAFWDRNFDAVRLQREFSEHEYSYYRMLNRMFKERAYKTKMIWEIDDVIVPEKMPDFNMSKALFGRADTADRVKRIVDLCDHVTVVSDYMKEMYEPFFMGKEIRVLKNYSHKGWFGGLYDIERRMRSYDMNKGRPRVLLAGGGTHFRVGSTNPADMGDYRELLPYFIKTRKDIKWVFMGHIPAPLEPFVANGDMEFVHWANLVEYPVALEATNCQVLVAPLELNDFNLAKSDIKYMESCYLGRPCVVQNCITYKNAPHRFSTAAECIDIIKDMTKDEQTYQSLCEDYHKRSDDMWLESNWDKVLEAYK